MAQGHLNLSGGTGGRRGKHRCIVNYAKNGSIIGASVSEPPLNKILWTQRPGRAVTSRHICHDVTIYKSGRPARPRDPYVHRYIAILRMRSATRKRSRPDRREYRIESVQLSQHFQPASDRDRVRPESRSSWTTN